MRTVIKKRVIKERKDLQVRITETYNLARSVINKMAKCYGDVFRLKCVSAPEIIKTYDIKVEKIDFDKLKLYPCASFVDLSKKIIYVDRDIKDHDVNFISICQLYNILKYEDNDSFRNELFSIYEGINMGHMCDLFAVYVLLPFELIEAFVELSKLTLKPASVMNLSLIMHIPAQLIIIAVKRFYDEFRINENNEIEQAVKNCCGTTDHPN